MHQSVRTFGEWLKSKRPSRFRNSRVLEIGSKNHNGSLRDLFSDPKEYTGIDAQEGEGVDQVGIAHEILEHYAGGIFDVAFATEVFEHDPYMNRTIYAMLHVLRQGGLFFTTCATLDRQKHGVPSVDGSRHSPGDPEFYQNRSCADFDIWLNHFSRYGFDVNPNCRTLMFWGLKK